MTNEMKCQLIDEIRFQEFSAKADELTALEKEFGSKVSDIVLKTRSNRIEEEWKKIAKDVPHNNIQGLLDTLWTWVGEIGFEYTYEREGNEVTMNVTKCPIADMAKKINQTEWGFKCYCSDDESIVRGFNPKIKFERTKTLMEGHECCNHKYIEE